MKYNPVLLVLISLGLLGGLAWKTDLNNPVDCPSMTVTLPNGTHLSAEVAATTDTRAQGLSGREKLADTSGMLFLFPDTAIHPFWMKNTHFPLDIIWINNHKVVESVTLPAETVELTPAHTPTAKANAVLELTAGSTKIYGIKKGDNIRWTLCL